MSDLHYFPVAFIPVKKSGTHLKKFLGPRYGTDVLEKKNISTPVRNRTPKLPVRSLVTMLTTQMYFRIKVHKYRDIHAKWGHKKTYTDMQSECGKDTGHVSCKGPGSVRQSRIHYNRTDVH